MENIDGEFFISIQTFSENHIFQLKKKPNILIKTQDVL